MSVMLDLLNLDLKGVDDCLYLSEPVIGDSIIAEVEFHGC